MKKSRVDPRRCPLCGNSNACGAAAGEKYCWCFFEPVPREVLQGVPAEARGIACVCRTCAMNSNALKKRWEGWPK